LIFSDVEVVL